MSDGPFCFGVDKLLYSENFLEAFSGTHKALLDESESLLTIARKEGFKNRMQGMLISEESYSFTLSFVSYNNATTHSPFGIIADRVIETDFNRKMRIVIEFDTPVIITQRFE
jgi:hypothetical protein